MALDLQPEGKDNRYDRLGDITSGSWSTQVDFTPHSIGSSNGGTGSASFTSIATDESDFTFARDITVSASVINEVGKINSLTLGSGTAQVQSDTLLSRLNTTKTFPPPYQGQQIYSYNNGIIPLSPAQAYTGFTLVGDVAYWANIGKSVGSRYTGPSTDDNSIFDGVIGSGVGQFSGTVGPSYTFRRPNGSIVTYMVDIGNSKVLRIVSQGDIVTEFPVTLTNPAFLTVDSSENVFIADNGADTSHAKRITSYSSTGTQQAQWATTPTLTSIACDPQQYGDFDGTVVATDGTNMYSMNSTTGAVLLTAAIPANSVQNPVICASRSIVWLFGNSLATADGTQNRKMILGLYGFDLSEFQRFSVSSASSVYGGTSTAVGVSTGSAFTDNNSGGVVWVSENLLDADGVTVGNTVSGYMTPDGVSLSNVYLMYLSSAIPAPFGYSFFADDIYGVAYPGWTANVWDQLKQLASATNTQFYASGGDVSVARAQGSNIYPVDQFVDGSNATITASVSGLSRKIQVVSQGSKYSLQGNQDVFYDAYADSNNVISIDVGQVSIVKVSTPHWPVGLDAVDPNYNYQIQDSNGLTVDPDDWSAAGGSIRASVDEDGQSINLTITGPIYALKGYAGPFSFSKDANRTASLFVTGWGILLAPQSLTLYTGAAEEFVSQDMGETITNPFIENVSQAYDRGAWATFDSAGPAIQLTFSVTDTDFNWTYGDRISYRDQYWRVTSYGTSPGKVSVTAVPYTTVDDAQGIWRGSTVAQYDEFWSESHGQWGGGYRVYDKKFRPLWNPRSLTPAPVVYLALDTDSAPFYDSTVHTPQQWISIDTDGVPYFSVTRDSYSTWLDIDGRPYYAIG